MEEGFKEIFTPEQCKKLILALRIYKSIYGEDFDPCTIWQEKIDRFQNILDGKVESE